MGTFDERVRIAPTYIEDVHFPTTLRIGDKASDDIRIA